MKRKFAIAAAIIAVFAFTAQATAQAGDAKSRRHVDKRITVVAIGVGAASTAAYFAINDWKLTPWNNGSGLTQLGAAALTTVGCMAVSPMVATVVVKRPLTMREGHVLLGSCVIPIIGGWLVNAAYNAHPEWEPQPAAIKKQHAKKKM